MKGVWWVKGMWGVRRNGQGVWQDDDDQLNIKKSNAVKVYVLSVCDLLMYIDNVN